ncbi:MAG: type IV pilus secretin PilQ [Thermodesulfobacteriota bacterium]
MRRAMRSTWLVFFMLLMTAALLPAWGAPPPGPAATGQAVSAGYLENVAFEKQPGRERVILTVTKLPEFTVENPPGNTVVVRLENLFVPEGLRRSLEDPSLANVIRVTPVQKAGDGRTWALAAIELRQRVPYSVRSEGMNVLIDFNVASLAAAVPAPQKPPTLQPRTIRQEELRPAAQAAPAMAAAGDPTGAKPVSTGARISLDVQDADIKSVLRLLAEQGHVSIVYGDDVRGTVTLSIQDVPWSQALDTVLGIKGLSRMDNGRIITVLSTENFQKIKGAEEERLRKAEEELIRRERKKRDEEPLITRIVPIKYRLLKDVFKSKIEIKRDVLLGGVKESAAGTVSARKTTPLSMDETKTKTVSVEGAGDFIQLLQSFLSTDSEGKQLGWIGADADTNSIIVTAVKRDLYGILDMIAKMDVPTDQIQIKANIVETTKNTARNLGIQWGGAFGQKLGNQNLFVTPGGTGGSTVPPGSVLSGGYTPFPGAGPGISGQGYGVNFPAGVMGATNPASLGLLFGTIGGNILDIQLSALQKDGKLNILSSPSLVTLDNQTASTESGEDIPFVTPATATSPATVTWKRAVLRLEITPHVVDVKNIKLTIVVKKDEADFSRLVLGQPTIIVKETKTDLVVADGETIVISGLTKKKGVATDTGVPWFKDIPGLGWLFKGEGKSEDMEETLIFITPTIMKAPEGVGIQTGPWKP